MSIRVASVPASHVYVRHLSAPGGEPDPVVRLADPPALREDTPTGAPWWPPAMLDPAWIAAHEFDLMHIHFGFDALSPDQLHEVVDALDAKGAPLVYTVHDLWNPHHQNTDLHDSQLEVLLTRAQAVITLSEEAAAQIRQRWGVQARVIPHPHVVDLDIIAALATAPLRKAEEFRLGIHLKSLRANMVGIPVLEAALEALSEIPRGVLQVDLHRDVFESDGARHDPELVSWLQDRVGEHLELHVHDYFSDAELFDYLSSLHASLLPYRFGTHSGWMEACHDLGTAVIAPDVGCYASQGADLIYGWDDGALDAPSLKAAVRAAAQRHHRTGSDAATRARSEAGAARPVTQLEATDLVRWRTEQRRAVSAAHAEVYREALLRSAGGAASRVSGGTVSAG